VAEDILADSLYYTNYDTITHEICLCKEVVSLKADNHRLKIYAAHATAIILWASAFPAIRYSIQSFSPEHLSLLRLLIGSAVLLLFSKPLKIRMPAWRDLPALIFLGALGFSIYHACLNLGEKTVSAGAASLLISTTPVITAILAAVFGSERIGRRGWIGAIIAFAGVCAVSVGQPGNAQMGAGISLILAAALSESVFFVFQKNLLQKYGFISFTAYSIWGGTIVLLIFSGGLPAAVANASVDGIVTALYLGVFPTIIPYFALAYITAKSGASEAVSSLYLTPLAAILIAWAWLGEVPGVLSIAGGAVTLAGVLISHLPDRKQKATRGEPQSKSG
jgi:drug/metabolite transporter (DMT)-like permease